MITPKAVQSKQGLRSTGLYGHFSVKKSNDDNDWYNSMQWIAHYYNYNMITIIAVVAPGHKLGSGLFASVLLLYGLILCCLYIWIKMCFVLGCPGFFGVNDRLSATFSQHLTDSRTHARAHGSRWHSYKRLHTKPFCTPWTCFFYL